MIERASRTGFLPHVVESMVLTSMVDSMVQTYLQGSRTLQGMLCVLVAL